MIKTFEGIVTGTGDFEKGRKIKEWNYFHQNGIIRLKENYDKGIQTGITSNYDRNGNLVSIYNYKNDTINGVGEIYRNNILYSIYNYDNDEKTGPYKVLRADGTIYTEGYFADGQVDFYRLSYWSNGNLYRKDKFEEEVLTESETFNSKGEKENSFLFKNKTGKFSSTNYNGSITKNYELLNGEYNGKYSQTDKLNTPVSESVFKNGNRIGISKTFSPLGTLFIEKSVYNELGHGKETTYDLVGNLKAETQNLFDNEYGQGIRYYHNKAKLADYMAVADLFEGPYTFYNQEGEALITLNYVDNVVQSYLKKDKNGALSEKVDVIGGNATIESLYPNGKSAINFSIEKGLLKGSFVINGVSGNKEYECNYEKNQLTSRTEYYSNGKIYKKENFKNGNFNGTQEFFKEDGKKWLTCNYVNDDLHGDTMIYSNGVLSLTKKYDSDELVEIIK